MSPIKRRSFVQYAGAFTLAAGASGIVAACAPAGVAAPKPATPRRGGTVTIANAAEIVSLDPAYSGDPISDVAQRLVYEGLVTRAPGTEELRPGLATSWDVKDTAWTFKLRTGVRFHDGTPFNASAVKAYFDRLIGPEQPLRRATWAPVLDRVEVVDDATVRFVTKFVDAFFLYRIEGGTAFIPSPEMFKRYGKNAATPIGTGPFRFVEWKKDEQFVAQRNEDYWGEKAYLDKVSIRAVPEPEARMVGLEAGDIQLAIRLLPEQVQRIDRNANLAKSEKTTTRSLFMGMNVMKKPLNDVRVRQAFNYAIDRESIAKNLYLGSAEPLSGLVAPGVPGYSGIQGYSFDRDKARQLLAQAGYPNGFSLSFVGPKGTYLKDFELQQAVQQQLKAVGVDAKLETLEYAKWLDLIRTDPTKSSLELYQDGWFGSDAASWVLDRFGCESFRPRGANTAGFCDPQITELATRGRSITDSASRDGVLKDAQNRLSQQAPAIWCVAVKEVAGMSRKLHAPIHRTDTVLTVDQSTWME